MLVDTRLARGFYFTSTELNGGTWTHPIARSWLTKFATAPGFSLVFDDGCDPGLPRPEGGQLVTLPPITARRGSCTALSLISALLVLTLPASDPLQPLAGLLLAGPLPVWSIDRLVLVRSRERPSAEVRCSLAVGFTLVAVVGVGLLLAVTPVELKVAPMVIGLPLVIATCDLSSAALPAGSALRHSPRIAAGALPAWPADSASRRSWSPVTAQSRHSAGNRPRTRTCSGAEPATR